MLIDHLRILFCEMPLMPPALFSIGLSVFLLLIFRSPLYSLSTNSLLAIYVANIITHAVAYFFTLLIVLF